MKTQSLGTAFLRELEAEAPATRKCLERIPAKLFNWKPHKRSLPMGYLALIVAEIPKWVTHMVEQTTIDFVTFPHFKPKTTEELVRHFDENMESAKQALQSVTDGTLEETFFLKANGQELYSSPKKENISSSINHMVHHRGQLTVYMRLNDIAVPSIYGPSADDKSF